MRNNEKLEKIWTEKIEDFKKSGLSQKDWCEANDLTCNQLKYWLYKSRIGTDQSQNTKRDPKWIPVDVKEDTDSIKNDDKLILKIGDISIEINPGYNKELLSDVLSLLKSVC